MIDTLVGSSGAVILQDQLNAQFDPMPKLPTLNAFENREEVMDNVIGGGFEPASNKVVVYPDPVPRHSPGGIAIPSDVVEKEEYAQIFATLCAVGPEAWKGMTHPAAPGDRVMIAKFTGQLFTGADGNRYRVIHDLDVIGKVTQEGVGK